MNSNKNDIAFGINIASMPSSTFRVIGFECNEALSTPFQLSASIACQASPDLKPAEIIDEKATLTIHHKYEQLIDDGVYSIAGIPVPIREFNGVIESVEHVSTNAYWTILQISIMPEIHRLRHTSDCQIFQNDSVPDIVTKIFGERGILDFEFDLKDSCHDIQREFCVQYNESHLAFIQRLLAEEGIFYYFKHEDGKHVMVMTDYAQGGQKLMPEPTVIHNDNSGGMIKKQYISQFSWRETLRPSIVKQREYSFKKPYYDQHQENFSLVSRLQPRWPNPRRRIQ